MRDNFGPGGSNETAELLIGRVSIQPLISQVATEFTAVICRAQPLKDIEISFNICTFHI